MREEPVVDAFRNKSDGLKLFLDIRHSGGVGAHIVEPYETVARLKPARRGARGLPKRIGVEDTHAAPVADALQNLFAFLTISASRRTRQQGGSSRATLPRVEGQKEEQRDARCKKRSRGTHRNSLQHPCCAPKHERQSTTQEAVAGNSDALERGRNTREAAGDYALERGGSARKVGSDALEAQARACKASIERGGCTRPHGTLDEGRNEQQHHDTSPRSPTLCAEKSHAVLRLAQGASSQIGVAPQREGDESDKGDEDDEDDTLALPAF